ncbi:MAG: bifunctional 23S rRNA (guanine(2069)-N(7))-methyltransferase RlmK/23S rRNA (guanine(2445)-N(2))-methyltransferase RlmL [Granulosicoccus sp.]
MPSSIPLSPSLATLADAELYASCGSGLESLLALEFKSLGFAGVQSAGAGVRFRGALEAGYKACLWSRVANRILLPIHRGPASTPEALYALVQEIDWSTHLDVDGTLAVDFFTAKSEITHSQYGALKVKDAVVDQFRDSAGRRPNVERETPDLRINVYLFRNQARVAIDLSGSSLHRRGYRDAGGIAPLKENLAASVLLASGWPDAIEQGKPLIDPMCGSGTLLIEAGMIACNQAPGLHRDYFGFQGWKLHDSTLWESLKQDAIAAQCSSPVSIVGADQDSSAIAICRDNIERAGLGDVVSVQRRDLADGRPEVLPFDAQGLLISNPPYGERLAGDSAFYSQLGSDLSRYYAGWQCSLFTAQAAPYMRARLPLSKAMQTRNGGIDCVLLVGTIPKAGAKSTASTSLGDPTINQSVDQDALDQAHSQASLYRGPRSSSNGSVDAAGDLVVDASPFVNRLKKNQRALKGWVKQNAIHAYRLYDADLPEFSVAIDVYNADSRHCVVQEYQAPATVNVAMAEARLKALLDVIPKALDVSPECVHLKVREVKSGNQQYEKNKQGQSTVASVTEFGAALEVNFSDYLDTGIFLDHRPVRRYLAQNCSGKRFLNLFAYTATATVAALVGGASSSVSVDTSNRYCQWAMRNLDRNGAAQQRHEVVRQDVFNWLESASVSIRDDDRFDIILLDPPTFSNSTGTELDWNVQRDHVAAIDACLRVLKPGGLIIFSNNYRRFKLDKALINSNNRAVHVEDRSRWSIDRDFQRNNRIHQCWFINKQ